MSTSRLELALLVGAESKQFLLDLNAALGRLEKLKSEIETLKGNEEDGEATPKKGKVKVESGSKKGSKRATKDDSDEDLDNTSDDEEGDLDEDSDAGSDMEDDDEESNSDSDDSDEDSDDDEDDEEDDGDSEDDSDEEDDEEDEEDEEDDDDDDEEEKKSKKKVEKKSKVTIDDCNDAAKELAAKKSRAYVLELMKKKFKTKSVSDLKPSQYEEFVAVMKKGK